MGLGFQPGQRFRGIVGVDGAQRAVMAGVHGLQHVEGFTGANFAADGTVGTHTEHVLEQFGLVDLALAFQILQAGFQAHHVRLLQLQFGSVFGGDHPPGVLHTFANTIKDQPPVKAILLAITLGTVPDN